MDVVYQGARNPSACKKRHKILCAKGARNPAQAGKKIASPKAINYIKHCNRYMIIMIIIITTIIMIIMIIMIIYFFLYF